MEVRRLGRSGLSVPVVGLGTWNVFNVREPEGQARCEAVVTAALASGAQLFDSSPMYGESERVLALSLAGRRQHALVATKVWARTRAQGEQQIERALEWYEHVDLYQVHNLLSYDDHLPFLKHLHEAGRVRALGATHYLPGEMAHLVELMRGGDLTAVQVPYHPLERTIEAELLPAARDLDIGVIAMTPFKTGELLARLPADAELAPLEPFGVRTWAQALLKWILSDDRISATIPATSSPSRMGENAAAGEPPWFGPDERAYVARLAETLAL
jgi:aryl-alcohol dehydrogenase-like predicted oxidoreductase